MDRNIPVIHDFAAQKKISVRRVMDFVTMANPLGPSSRARDAIRKSLKMIDRPVDDSARYLRHAIARHRDIPEENILVSASFEMLFGAIARAFGVGTALACTPYPSYYRKIMKYPVSFHFLELEENNHFDLDPGHWEKALPGCDAAIISYPSFLAEKPLTHDDVITMAACARDRGTHLIIDETLLGYLDAASAAKDIIGQPQCLVVSSLTEFYALPGLPVAYCIGDAVTLNAIRQRSPVDPPSTPAAAAGTASLSDKEYSRRTHAYFAKKHVFIEDGLRKIPGVSFYRTSCGSFIVQCERPRSDKDIFSRYNILVDEISGSLFFPVKNHKWNSRYLRTLKNIMGGSHQ